MLYFDDLQLHHLTKLSHNKFIVFVEFQRDENIFKREECEKNDQNSPNLKSINFKPISTVQMLQFIETGSSR